MSQLFEAREAASKAGLRLRMFRIGRSPYTWSCEGWSRHGGQCVKFITLTSGGRFRAKYIKPSKLVALIEEAK